MQTISNSIAFTAPHQAAAEAGLEILKKGGTATEAMVSAAAVISVVYPHMNSIGGDGFWLIHNRGDEQPVAIDACGCAPGNISAYKDLTEFPTRGGQACITGAATVAGWAQALASDKNASVPVKELLARAIAFAENGIEVTASLQAAVAKVLSEPAVPESFKALYAPQGKPVVAGERFKNQQLADTLKMLAENGLADFYQGDVGKKIINALAEIESPISSADHASTEAKIVAPLSISLNGLRCFNLPAPTQGVHSLQILAQVEQLKHDAQTEADWVHLIIEATKQSFAERSHILACPGSVPVGYYQALTAQSLNDKAAQIDMQLAKPWPFVSEHGDTVWMGARDKNGQLVSFIQSVYWEFGSAEVLNGLGFTWNNRGISFSLSPGDINVLAPGKKPRHTLNPAMALFNNGNRLSYGTMGGEGQPQTQAALFSRFVWQRKSLQAAVAEGRWLLGRTWGDDSNDLKVEADLAELIGEELTRRKHQWQSVPPCNEMMGHAGAIWDSQQTLEAVTDPRSDGGAFVS
jgi:gamma-glutamyltranspeptidase/glutathione hydrolase